jgi:hypothetical protein
MTYLYPEIKIMKKLILVAGLIFLSVGYGCKNSNTEKQATSPRGTDSASKKDTTRASGEAEAKAGAIVEKTIGYYLQLKNALVSDDAVATARHGKEMKEYLDKVDKSVFDSRELAAYSKIEKELKDHSDHISKNEKDIVHQREHFSMMSDNLYLLVDRFGAGRTLYRDYCPMYNNNEGAFWLSESEEIRNPYFGNKMLTCGQVKTVIK